MGGHLGLESRTPGMDPAPIRTAEVTVATIVAMKVAVAVAVAVMELRAVVNKKIIAVNKRVP